MTNIREDLKKLLIEANKAERFSIKTSDSAEPEDKTTFWGASSFYLLCEEAIINTGCLDKISICLHANFNPDTNPYFIDGINEFISFYIDVINSYNKKELIGSVKRAVSVLEKDILSEKKLSESTINGIVNFFTNTDHTAIIKEKDYNLLVEQLKNLCIASNIVNWKRLMVLAGNNNIRNIKNIFNKDKSENAEPVISNLSEPLIKKFYTSNNEFSNFLSSLSWGKLTEDTVPEWEKLLAKKREDTKKAKIKKEKETENSDSKKEVGSISGSSDVGTISGDNEQFVYNVLVRYLVNIITSDILDVENIFKSANKEAINSVINTSLFSPGSHVSIDADEEESDFASNLQDEKNKTEIIPSLIEFELYIKNLKKEKNWGIKDTLFFLSKVLNTKEGADGLSSIISKTLTETGDNILGLSFIAPTVVDNKLNYFNFLSYIKDKALKDNNFLPFLSNLLVSISEENLQENTNLKQDLFSIFYEAKRANEYGILPVDIEELIEDLPKTREEAINSYVVSHGSHGHSLSEITNKAAFKINNLYKTLQSAIPVFEKLSPSETIQIPETLLHSGSELQKALNINIIPAVKIISSNITAAQAAQGITSVKLNQKDVEKLSQLFDIYLKNITDILNPSVNLQSWGLYDVIPGTIKTADYHISDRIAVFPSAKVPINTESVITIKNGVKEEKLVLPNMPIKLDENEKIVDKKVVKFLFPSEAAFNSVRTDVLNAIKGREQRFLSATKLEDIVKLLSEIMNYFGPNASKIRLFSSKNTVLGTDEAKNCALYNLLDPKLAITDKLKKIDEKHSFVAGGITNPFVDLVSNILVLNNQQKTNESIVFNRLSIFEDVPAGVKEHSYELPICYVAINIQIRARILLALIKFVDVLEAILILLRRIVIGLHGIIIAMLSEDSYGEIKKLFNSISKALAGIVSSGADEETISKMINDYIKTVNAFYRESQKITDEFIQNETAPVSLDDTTYG